MNELSNYVTGDNYSTSFYLQYRNNILLEYCQKEYFANYNRTRLPQCFSYGMVSTYTGKVTKSAQKNIRTAVELLCLSVPERIIKNPISKTKHPFKLAFLTLTLSDNSRFISGKEAYKNLLKPTLDWFRKTKGINTYIWKAERQKPIDKAGKLKESHGQLHYHITLPNFLAHSEIKEKWNYLQSKAGYLDNHFEKFGNRNPNSIDIHAVHKIRDIESYLIKYISKMQYTHLKSNEELIPLPKNSKNNTIMPKVILPNQKMVSCIELNGNLVIINNSVEGKVWDCSSNLKGKKHFNFEIENFNRQMLQYLKENDCLYYEYLDNCKLLHVDNEFRNFIMTKEQFANYKIYRNNLTSSINLA
jgi:hypothetical protein